MSLPTKRPPQAEALRRVEYVLAATRPQERREAFAATLWRHLPGSGGELMNYVEQIEARGELKGRRAGREEGRQEALLKTTQRLLRQDVPWSIIEKAAGIDEARLRALKQQLPASSAANDAQDTE